jgi:hypothetical protein
MVLGDPPGSPLAARLASDEPLLGVELRPPRRDLFGERAMDAWIDVYQAVQRLSGADTLVFLTDNAVGAGEEENLGHLVKNLGLAAARDRLAPFLTLKHSLDYCLRFARRARTERFPALVVLGGDKHDGIPRCLPHAWQLREKIREEQPGLLLGGWANPYRDPAQQAEFLAQQEECLDFVLTQILSHHDLAPVKAFLEEVDRRGVKVPLIGGVFFYRSARRKTLETLANFIPVPREGVRKDFRELKLSPEEVAARTVTSLMELGMRRFYLSNFETARAAPRLRNVARLVGLPDPTAPTAPPLDSRRRV